MSNSQPEQLIFKTIVIVGLLGALPQQRAGELNFISHWVPLGCGSSSSSRLELPVSVLELGVCATCVPEQPRTQGRGDGAQGNIL